MASTDDLNITSEPEFDDEASLDAFDDDGFEYASLPAVATTAAPTPDSTKTKRVTSSADVSALREWAAGQRRVALALTPDDRLAVGADDGTAWELDARRVGIANAALTAVAQSGAYLWAYDATSIYQALGEKIGLAVGGIRCAQTAWLTHHPVVGDTRDNLHLLGDSNAAVDVAVAVAQLVEKIHAEATPTMRQHILTDVRTDDLWRRPGLRGYAVDEEALEREARLIRAAQQHSVDKFGIDLTIDHLALTWMAERGVTCTDGGEPTCGYKKLPDADVPPGMDEEWAEFVALREIALLRNVIVSLKRKLRCGRAYPRINAVGAVTGRMSITGPAMQATPGRLRHLFRADPGMTLVACDLDRVEPCLVAAASADPGLVAATTSDIYVELAVSVWGEPARANGERRAQAKTALNAITYGQGPASLARRLGLPLEEAQAVISGWAETYPHFHHWMKRVTAAAKNGEPLTTLTGRVLPTPTHPYQAISYIIQGTAADIFKASVLRVAAETPSEFHLWLPIHDELVLAVPDDTPSVERAVNFLAAGMETEINGVRITGTPVHLGPIWRKS
jgi:hypothetical protein